MLLIVLSFHSNIVVVIELAFIVDVIFDVIFVFTSSRARGISCNALLSDGGSVNIDMFTLVVDLITAMNRLVLPLTSSVGVAVIAFIIVIHPCQRCESPRCLLVLLSCSSLKYRSSSMSTLSISFASSSLTLSLMTYQRGRFVNVVIPRRLLSCCRECCLHLGYRRSRRPCYLSCLHHLVCLVSPSPYRQLSLTVAASV